MAEKRILKSTREDELGHEVVRLRTRLNMLRYHANQQIHYHEETFGMPQTRLDRDIITVWKTVLKRLEGE